MLEIIAGIVVALAIGIAAIIIMSGLAIFMGTIKDIDSDAFSDDD